MHNQYSDECYGMRMYYLYPLYMNPHNPFTESIIIFNVTADTQTNPLRRHIWRYRKFMFWLPVVYINTTIIVNVCLLYTNCIYNASQQKENPKEQLFSHRDWIIYKI